MQIRFNNWALKTIIPYIIALTALNSRAEPSLNDRHQTQKEKIISVESLNFEITEDFGELAPNVVFLA